MSDNERYYDAFSEAYDRGRERGYHALIDEQAAALVQPFAANQRALEVGCGTGLVLERVAKFAREARGIDLSEGMLEKARHRGLEVQQANCTELPFDDASFDVAYSFKVLAHVPEIEVALAEMARVVVPGGYVIADFYNRNSIRYWTKRLAPARRTSDKFNEAAILTRFDRPRDAAARLPKSLRVESMAGIRICTVHAAQLQIPGIASLTRWTEWALMRSPFAAFAGFGVVIARKTGG